MKKFVLGHVFVSDTEAMNLAAVVRDIRCVCDKLDTASSVLKGDEEILLGALNDVIEEMGASATTLEQSKLALVQFREQMIRRAKGTEVAP